MDAFLKLLGILTLIVVAALIIISLLPTSSDTISTSTNTSAPDEPTPLPEKTLSYPNPVEGKQKVPVNLCMSTFNKSEEEVKEELQRKSRENAVDKIYGSLILSITDVENFRVTKTQLQNIAIGKVRLGSDPKFDAGAEPGQMCIQVEFYTLPEDRALFEPHVIHGQACESAQVPIKQEVQRDTQQKAELDALYDYMPGLRRGKSEDALALMFEVHSEEKLDNLRNGVYCVEVEAKVVPIVVELGVSRLSGGISPGNPLISSNLGQKIETPAMFTWTHTLTPTNSPTPTITPTPTETPTSTTTPSSTPTPTWTRTPTFTATPAPIPTDTATWTPTATWTFTPTPTKAPTPEALRASSIRVSSTAPDSWDGGGNRVSYPATNLIDGRQNTAWRASWPSARSVWVEFVFRTATVIQRIEMLPGYDKNDPYDNTDRWRQNYRPRRVRIFVDGAEVARFTLQDVRQWQTLLLPKPQGSRLRIQIDSVYGSGERPFVAISEIRFWGFEP